MKRSRFALLALLALSSHAPIAQSARRTPGLLPVRVVEDAAQGPGELQSVKRFHHAQTRFPGTLAGDSFGSSIALLGDLDGNGVGDVAVGAAHDDFDMECDLGAVWILFLGDDGTAIDYHKITEGEGGFDGDLEPGDEFGSAVTAVPDLNGDGVPELAVGAPGDDTLVENGGAVWLLFPLADGTVQAHIKLLHPGQSPLPEASFGESLATLGDLDGDGRIEIAVGAPGPPGNTGIPTTVEGSLWILSVDLPTVLGWQAQARTAQGVTGYTTISSAGFPGRTRIGNGAGGFAGAIQGGDRFGCSVTPIGDVNGDGACDIAVGASDDNEWDRDSGAVWILFLGTDGDVLSHHKINGVYNEALFELGSADRFGSSVSALGDADGNGVPDLVVGYPGENLHLGAFLVLFLKNDGSVLDARKNNLTPGEPRDQLGKSVAAIGDVDGDGVVDVMAGAPSATGTVGYFPVGSVHTFFLEADGASSSVVEIGQGGWSAPVFLSEFGAFGGAVECLGDLAGTGGSFLAIGQPRDALLGTFDGAVWLLELDGNEDVVSVRKHARGTGFPGALRAEDEFGAALAVIGDLDGNGVPELAVGAPGDSDGKIPQYEYGAVWILFLAEDGAVLSHQEISRTEGGLNSTLDDADRFGHSIVGIGDLDGDGVSDLAVGGPTDPRFQSYDGTVWILLLNTDGTVKASTEVLVPDGLDGYGTSLAHLGGNRIAVGGPDDAEGAIWIVDLLPDGSLAASNRVGLGLGGFTGAIEDGDRFGVALSATDLDGDGIRDLAVGVPRDDGTPAPGSGAVWFLFLNADGTVAAHARLGSEDLNVIPDIDQFGSVLAFGDDHDGNGVPDLFVGSPSDGPYTTYCDNDFGSVLLLGIDGVARIGGDDARDVRARHRTGERSLR